MAGLDRDRVVRTALDLLDEAGLDGLTLRKLASVLGVQAPALYWHFANKQALLDEMATTMFRDMLADWLAADRPEPSWQDLLMATGRSMRTMLRSRRDGAKMVSGTYLTDDSMVAAMEEPLRILTAVGFSVRDATRAFMTVYSYTVGFTIEEQAVLAAPERYDADRRRARVDAERQPLTAAASPDVFGDPDDRFEFGLRVIITGLAAVPDDDSPVPSQ